LKKKHLDAAFEKHFPVLTAELGFHPFIIKNSEK